MSKATKKILILGGEGFIGQNLTRGLGPNYACDSVGLKKSPFPSKTHHQFIKLDPYEQNLKNQRPKNDYEAIIHLIDNQIDLESFPDQELKLIENLNLKPANHLIVFSSSAVYADPNSAYAKRKISQEGIFEKYCPSQKIRLTIIRLFNVFGPFQLPGRPGSLVANLFCNYLNHQKTVINNPKARRDFLYAPDIARFLEYIIKNQKTGTLDLAANQLISLAQIIKTIQDQVIKDKLLLDIKADPGQISCPPSRNKLVEKVKPTPLAQGLTETYRFYKKNLKIINRLTRFKD